MGLNELRFDHLVRDLEPDRQAYEREFDRVAPATRKYVIFFSPRSGSSWLTTLLSGTGLLGHPEEYFNPNFIRNVAKALNSKDKQGFLDMLIRRRKTPNGVFGVEVRGLDVRLFDPERFFQTFGADTVFFHLWRANIVAQGISLYRAVKTQHFHSSEQAQASAPPPYDSAGIRHWVEQVALAENDNLKMLEEQGFPFTNLCYEDLVKDRAGTIQRFAAALSVNVNDEEASREAPGELKKIGDTWNLAAEALFREDCKLYVEDIELNRRIMQLVKLPLGTANS